MEKAALFWSGGKDCAFALYTVLNQKEYQVVQLVTTLNEQSRRISMHGIREEILDMQSASLGLPMLKMWTAGNVSNENYAEQLIKTYEQLKQQGITVIVYGDIFLEDLRLYREKLLQRVGLKGYFPLWGYDTRALMKSSLDLGFRSLTCCINTASLDEKWVGKLIDKQFIDDLPADADPCGENGEFHTLCYDAPIFERPVHFGVGEKVYRPLPVNTTAGNREAGFWYVDLYLINP